MIPFRVLRLNHVAIAMRDAREMIEFYRYTLNLPVSERRAQPEHGVYTTFVEFPGKGSTSIELLEPLLPSSPICQFVEKREGRPGLHHFCFEVDDLAAAIDYWQRERKLQPLGKGPQLGAHGNPVVFLHPKDCQGFLTELEEVKK